MTVWRSLDEAVSHVEAGWQQVVEDSPAQEEVRTHLVQLAGAIRAAADGGDPLTRSRFLAPS